MRLPDGLRAETDPTGPGVAVADPPSDVDARPARPRTPAPVGRDAPALG
jgi:hypothetical protein